MNKPSLTDNAGRLGQPAPVTAADNIKGPSNASITIVEYSDFQCPACESFYPVIEKFMADASTTARLIYRHFPLNDVQPDGTVQHPNALLAAQASEAAAKQGKFWEMYDLLFKNHTDWTELHDPHSVFIGYANSLKLNIDQFKVDLDATSTQDFVLAQKAEGVKLGINSTPTFFVNGTAINNVLDYEQFKSLIEATAQAHPL